MEIIVFILLAGVWAAFLLPSFFEHRRHSPGAATRDFARSKELLASVSAATPYGNTYARRHAQARRRRFVIGLLVAAATTLVIAIMTGSVYWLAASVVIDVTIGGYVTMLLSIRQRGTQRGSVVRLPVAVPEVLPARSAELEETPTVRVIAG